MDESDASQYWCHMCSQTVNPIIGIETIKCPICQSGFVEEMASAEASENFTDPSDSDPDPALSLWAPILLGMMDNSRRLRRIRRMEFNSHENEDSNNGLHHYGETELDRELESIIRQRRRSSATILHLLEGIRAGIQSSEFGNNPNTDNNNNRERERVIFIDPSNQTFMVHGSSNSEQIGSLGDYFTGPGLELLLQHLSENDPNRYGTPPARKEAVEGLANVKIEETIQCSVCLDECEIGVEVKEMPCKHKFHGECILPWLELHSSCPVCRYQLPFDESKVGGSDLEGPRNGSNNGGGDNSGNENGRRFSAPLVWPFSSLFSSSSSGDSSPSTSRGDED